MSFQRALAALACVALALPAVACAKILGIPSDPEGVSTRMCNCADVLDLFESGKECETYIDERLAEAADDVLASWLDAYDARCSQCAGVRDCFYLAPVCKTRGCTSHEECCSAKKWLDQPGDQEGPCNVETGICSQ